MKVGLQMTQVSHVVGIKLASLNDGEDIVITKEGTEYCGERQ